MILLALFACGASPLADVPIEGGTAEQRDAVRAAIDFFEAAVGPGRVELRAVRIEPSEEWAGKYDSSSRTVHMAEDAAIGSTMRHELCHALVDQDELYAQDPQTMKRVADVLFDPEYRYRPDVSEYPDAESQWSETVATLCENGPYWASDTVDNSCIRIEEFEVDPALTDAAAAWMLEHVWSAFRRPEPLIVDLESDAVRVAAFGSMPDAVDPTADPRVVAVTDTDGEVRRFDLYDGVEVVSELPPTPSPAVLPTGLGMWTPLRGMAGWRDGPAAYFGNWIPLPLAHGGTVRILAHDGVEWRYVNDGCGTSDKWMFAADDAVWMAWREDGLRWVELGRR